MKYKIPSLNLNGDFRMNKFAKSAILLAAAAATAAAPAGAASGGAAPAPAAGSAPDSNVAGAEKPKRAPKNPENKLDIINGRLPLALVYAIRFKEVGKPTGETAKKYGTSVGKVFDIVKGRNFGYVTEGYKPSADEVAAANAWCDAGKTAKGKTLKEAGGDPDGIKSIVAAMGVATAEEVAARNWQVRTVGQPAAAGTAPVAPAAAAGKGAATAKGDTKLFPA